MSTEALRLDPEFLPLDPPLRIEPKPPAPEQVFAEKLRAAIPTASRIEVTSLPSGVVFDIQQRPGQNPDPFALIRRINHIARQEFQLVVAPDSEDITFPDDENDLNHVQIKLSFEPLVS